MEKSTVWGKLNTRLFSEAGYQYMISPYWDVVDGLGKRISGSGNPMELRRKTLLPCQQAVGVVSMRSPSGIREDLEKLLEEGRHEFLQIGLRMAGTKHNSKVVIISLWNHTKAGTQRVLL